MSKRNFKFGVVVPLSEEERVKRLRATTGSTAEDIAKAVVGDADRPQEPERARIKPGPKPKGALPGVELHFKKVTIYMDPETHHELRYKSYRAGMDISALIRACLQEKGITVPGERFTLDWESLKNP
ncbi:MAG: hypothetical protein HY751_02350 [Nitrospinae bacterium]|nr:hypothetical protein [Nitrospinota bacterium]